MSKIVLFVGLLFSSVAVYGDCALEQYEKFVTLQNQSFTDALAMMKKSDSANYEKVKDFVTYRKKFNSFYLYVAGKLAKEHKDLLSYKSGISRLVKDRRRIVGGDKLAYVWDDVLGDDERYKKEAAEIRSQQNHFLYFKPKSNKPEDMANAKAFKDASTVFNRYLDKTEQMETIKATYSKTAEELCATQKGAVTKSKM